MSRQLSLLLVSALRIQLKAAIALLLLPLIACTVTAGKATPPAVDFILSLQGSGRSGGGFGFSAKGTANQTGEADFTLTIAEPEQHTYRIIEIGDAQYESEDGGPYRVSHNPAEGSGLAALVPGPGTAELSPACAAAQTGLGSVLEQAARGEGTGSTIGIENLGTATIDAAQTQHVGGTVDLSSALSPSGAGASLLQLISACAEEPESEPSLLQLALAGATLRVDAYVETASGIARRYSLDLVLPIASANISVSGTLTPLAAPAAITAPAVQP